MIQSELRWDRTIVVPSCRFPRLPVHAPRKGMATISPVGVTRFRRGSVISLL